jgi:hypothetical protein
MRGLTITALGLGILLAVSHHDAAALNCYVILDRNDAVLYQDTLPPVDMSEGGAAARSDMRQRGQYLMMMDSDRCPRLVVATGPASGPAAVEDIVSGMRTYGGASGGARPAGRAPSGTR